MKVLDLFCGAGGLSYGFNKEGFRVTGADVSEKAENAYKLNKIGNFINADLSNEIITDGFDVIVGGPPCKPWSSVNLTRRTKTHKDYGLVGRFFKHVESNMPGMFLFENVPAVANDKTLNWHIKRLSNKFNYSIAKDIVGYKDYGAPTKRKRFIVFGVRKGNAQDFFQGCFKYKTKNYSTVRKAIGHLDSVEFGKETDHEWPKLNTIHKYMKYYKTGKYGWHILKWQEQAPSFGNVMKTYILHPGSFNGGDTRTISVREAMLLMGFPKTYHFSEDAGLGARYQMIVDSVSPVFSRVVAKSMKNILESQ